MQITLGPRFNVGEVLGLDGVRNLLVYSTTQYYNTIVIKCIPVQIHTWLIFDLIEFSGRKERTTYSPYNEKARKGYRNAGISKDD